MGLFVTEMDELRLGYPFRSLRVCPLIRLERRAGDVKVRKDVLVHHFLAHSQESLTRLMQDLLLGHPLRRVEELA